MQPLEMEPRGGHESDSRVIVFVPGCPAGEGQEPGWPGVAAHAYDITSRRIADERNGKEIPHSFVGARLAQSWTRPRGRATTLSSDTSPWIDTRDSEVRTPTPHFPKLGRPSLSRPAHLRQFSSLMISGGLSQPRMPSRGHRHLDRPHKCKLHSPTHPNQTKLSLYPE